jgi:hypothetical protein
MALDGMTVMPSVADGPWQVWQVLVTVAPVWNFPGFQVV